MMRSNRGKGLRSSRPFRRRLAPSAQPRRHLSQLELHGRDGLVHQFPQPFGAVRAQHFVRVGAGGQHDDPHLHLLLASEERVQEAHAAGFRVNVYTVDDPAAQRGLSGFGVDGVFTNLPGRLRANLSE